MRSHTAARYKRFLDHRLSTSKATEGGPEIGRVKMRPFPDLSTTGSFQHPRKQETTQQRLKSLNSAFEQSVGYRLATEGSHTDMGAGGTLQIWPNVTLNHANQHLSGSRHRVPYQPSVISSAAGDKSDDLSTLHSYYDASRAPLVVSQQTSMSSVRDAALRKGLPTIHTAVSQPNLHHSMRDMTIVEPVPPPPKTSHSSRSQRLGFSRIFGRDKDKSAKESARQKREQQSSDYPPRETKLAHVKASVRPMEIVETPAIIQRSQNTVFDRNQTENAKVNVRRPPKGIKYWFEGLDGSDDELPKVLQPAPEPQVAHATFRPALGPTRLRAAPTARIPLAAELEQDRFQFSTNSQYTGSARNSAANTNGKTEHDPDLNLQNHSMLNLSSSDEDEPSEPPSPERWAGNGLGIRTSSTKGSPGLERSNVGDASESIFSMQTTMTSGTIPIINADPLYCTPLSPMPRATSHDRQKTLMSPSLRSSKSEVHMSRHRAPTGQSIPGSIVSEASFGTSGSTHVMTVTQEEMALLEMMRRKRAEMHSGTSSPKRGHVAEKRDKSRSHVPRKKSRSRSIASSDGSHDSLDSPGGIAFPTPPTASAEKKSIKAEAVEQNLNRTDERMLAHIRGNHATAGKQESSAQTILCELEAPMDYLPASYYSHSANSANSTKSIKSTKSTKPTRPARPTEPSKAAQTSQEAQAPALPPKNPRRISTSQSPPTPKTKTNSFFPKLPYNPADPYHLAPDLEFSPMNLLPLPARAYSPSLNSFSLNSPPSLIMSRSSGAPSQFSAGLASDTGSQSSSGSTGVATNAYPTLGQDVRVVNQDAVCEMDANTDRTMHADESKNPSITKDVLAAWTALGGGI